MTEGGGIEWQMGVGGPRDNALVSLVATEDGVILASQTLHSFYTFGSCASWVVKVGREGEIAWQKVFNNGGCDQAQVFESGAGEPMVAGSVQEGAYGQDDIWFGTLDPDGGIPRSVLVGDGSRDERLYAAAAYGTDLVLAGTMDDSAEGVVREADIVFREVDVTVEVLCP